jgi:hypothetical protein
MCMRRSLLSLFIVSTFFANAQPSTKANLVQLRKAEDSMKRSSRQMIMDENASTRFAADSLFIRQLVRTLKTPYSFNYPFDSIETVSKMYAPDSSFRIFTWQFSRDDKYFRQRGAIQMNTSDGSLKLFPLLDMSEFTKAPEDSVRTPQNWIGSIYYGIVKKSYNNKNYYTLLGFDDNTMSSTKKWIDVLSFDEQGRPQFGGSYFQFPNDSVTGAKANARFSMEFKKDGRARMNYDSEMDMIIFDHLVSESNEPQKAYTLIPDGDYCGFKWEKGKWVYIDKVFDFKLKDGEAPVPAPIKDDKGNTNEQMLFEQSEKNRQKEKAKQQTPPAKKSVQKQKDRQPKDENEW